jgi:hypothetical protein
MSKPSNNPRSGRRIGDSEGQNAADIQHVNDPAQQVDPSSSGVQRRIIGHDPVHRMVANDEIERSRGKGHYSPVIDEPSELTHSDYSRVDTPAQFATHDPIAANRCIVKNRPGPDPEFERAPRVGGRGDAVHGAHPRLG